VLPQNITADFVMLLTVASANAAKQQTVAYTNAAIETAAKSGRIECLKTPRTPGTHATRLALALGTRSKG